MGDRMRSRYFSNFSHKIPRPAITGRYLVWIISRKWAIIRNIVSWIWHSVNHFMTFASTAVKRVDMVWSLKLPNCLRNCPQPLNKLRLKWWRRQEKSWSHEKGTLTLQCRLKHFSLACLFVWVTFFHGQHLCTLFLPATRVHAVFWEFAAAAASDVASVCPWSLLQGERQEGQEPPASRLRRHVWKLLWGLPCLNKVQT